MATFADVGKDVNDQFTKDLPKEQNVELSAKVNNYFSFLLKGVVKGDNKVAGTFAPTIKVPDYNIEVKPELTTPDDKGKTYKVEVSANDAITKGLKFELGASNGKEGETFVGAVYKNAKFGGVTGRLSLPSGKDKYFTPSIYLETAETKGFGVGATAKVVLGENASVETYKALGSYKKGDISAFFGVDHKKYTPPKKPVEAAKPAAEKAPEKVAEKAPEKAADKPAPKVEVPPEFHTFVVGGFLKRHDQNKQFGANGSYDTANGDLVVELLYRKNYEDGTFLKLKGDLKGVVSVSKQFKPQSGVTVTLGTNVNVYSGEGNAGFQFSTDL